MNKENAIPISYWKKDLTDTELFKISSILEYISTVYDVRSVIKEIITKNGIINWKKFELLQNPGI